MSMQFEWDDNKAFSNQAKHGVTFAEAATVFSNPLAAIFDDVVHSDNRLREIIIGHSDEGRALIVVFTERAENTVHIISARPATRRERQDYEENTGL